MRRANGAILGILLASVAVPAIAADMPVKAAPAPMTPNVLLGVLYRHHEFPSGTVSFVDDTGGSGRAVSFGTSRATVDSVQGRLSLLFPIL
jgi:hypothetical protein